LVESAEEGEEAVAEGVWRASSGTAKSRSSMAKKRQHFETIRFIGYVRSTSSD
jgi:hypothetical protein